MDCGGIGNTIIMTLEFFCISFSHGCSGAFDSYCRLRLWEQLAILVIFLDTMNMSQWLTRLLLTLAGRSRQTLRTSMFLKVIHHFFGALSKLLYGFYLCIIFAYCHSFLLSCHLIVSSYLVLHSLYTHQHTCELACVQLLVLPCFCSFISDEYW